MYELLTGEHRKADRSKPSASPSDGKRGETMAEDPQGTSIIRPVNNSDPSRPCGLPTTPSGLLYPGVPSHSPQQT